MIDWLGSLASLLQLIEGEKKRQALMDLLLIEQKHCSLMVLLITDETIRLGTGKALILSI